MLVEVVVVHMLVVDLLMREQVVQAVVVVTVHLQVHRQIKFLHCMEQFMEMLEVMVEVMKVAAAEVQVVQVQLE